MATAPSIARPRRCSTRIERAGDVLMIRRRFGSFLASGLLALWLCGATCGGVRLAVDVAQRPTFARVLLTVPVSTSWAVMAGLLIRTLFGSDLLRIGPDGVDHRSRALALLRKRHIPLDEIKDATLGLSGNRYQLKIESLGRPLQVDVGTRLAEALWLEELVLRHIERLQPDFVPRSDDGPEPTEVLHPDDPPPGPPSDSMVHRDADCWNGTTFIRRGSLPIAVLCASFMAQSLWAFRVLDLFGQHFPGWSWFALVFMMPYGAGGIALSLGFIARFWVERWTIRPGAVTARVSLFGLGPGRHIEPESVAQVELRTHAGWLRKRTSADDDDWTYALGFVARDGRDLLTIDDLTEGEARWMGGHMCRLLACDAARGPLT